MWKTLGHQNQKTFLNNAIEIKRYAHAYLFCGPSAVGKKTLAVEFAQKLLGVQPAELKRPNPDLIVLDSEKINIEEMRRLISELALKPYHYAHKVAIIDNFENVSEEASSSILKTLEEPSPSTILILIANNRKAIMPTIVSRTQLLNFGYLAAAEKSALQKLLPRESASENSFAEKAEVFQKIKNSNSAEKILAIKEYSELENSDLATVLQLWLDGEHQNFANHPENYKILNLLVQSLAGLKKNLNKKLILQKLFLNL